MAFFSAILSRKKRLVLRGVGSTHAGRRRPYHEDRFGIFPSAGLACVADGTRSHPDAESASALAVASVARGARWIAAARDVDEIASHLDSIYLDAHERIIDYSLAHIESFGIGTTLTLAWLRQDGQVELRHLGDSRAYLFSRGSLYRITRDHILEAERSDHAGSSEGPKRPSYYKHYVGGFVLPRQHERYTQPVSAGDRIILCTDGLTDLLDDRKIVELCRQHDDCNDMVRALIAAAVAAGGKDDITVVALDIIEARDTASEPKAGYYPEFDIGRHIDLTRNLGWVQYWRDEPHPLLTLPATQQWWLREIRTRLWFHVVTIGLLRDTVARNGILDREKLKQTLDTTYSTADRLPGQPAVD